MTMWQAAIAHQAGHLTKSTNKSKITQFQVTLEQTKTTVQDAKIN